MGRYTAPVRRRPSGSLFARMVKQHEKRVLHCRNLKDAVCILDQELTSVLTRTLAPTTFPQDNVPRNKVRPLISKNRRSTNSTTDAMPDSCPF